MGKVTTLNSGAVQDYEAIIYIGTTLYLTFLLADESQPGTGITRTFSSTGYGFILKAVGNTLLGGSLFARISVQARYDLNGEPENNGTPLVNNIAKENVNFNSISIGVSLGVSYIF